MPAPQTILDLIQRFTEQRAAYKAGKYNETQLRRDFLDPFFEALGWDVSNRAGAAERFREVIHEVSVEVDGAAKAADYAFRIGGAPLFFVEAKKTRRQHRNLPRRRIPGPPLRLVRRPPHQHPHRL